MPVQKSASGSFAHHDFPRGDHLKLIVTVFDMVELLRGEHVGIDQIETVLDHSLAQFIVASIVTLNNVHHELHHVLLNARLLGLHGVHFLHASLNQAHYELACVAINQDYPFIDQELFGLKFNLNGLEHLYSLDYDIERGLGHCSVILLEQKQVHFERAFDLCGQLDSCGDLVCADV